MRAKDNKQLLRTLGADVWFSGKKIRKTLEKGGTHSPSSSLYVRGQEPITETIFLKLSRLLLRITRIDMDWSP